MELCTTIKPRKDGTVIVSIPTGRGSARIYTFAGEPLVCEVEDEQHAKQMLATNNFMTREDFEDEMDFRRRAAERRARQVAQVQLLQATQSAAAAAAGNSFVPDLGEDSDLDGDGMMDDDDEQTDAPTNAPPVEAGTKPTGRVRRAQKG